jgi:hypothetical protein
LLRWQIKLLFYLKLHDKFVSLKKQHSEQKELLEIRKKQLDEERKQFQQRRLLLDQARIGGTLKSSKKK